MQKRLISKVELTVALELDFRETHIAPAGNPYIVGLEMEAGGLHDVLANSKKITAQFSNPNIYEGLLFLKSKALWKRKNKKPTVPANIPFLYHLYLYLTNTKKYTAEFMDSIAPPVKHLSLQVDTPYIKIMLKHNMTKGFFKIAPYIQLISPLDYQVVDQCFHVAKKLMSVDSIFEALHCILGFEPELETNEKREMELE